MHLGVREGRLAPIASSPNSVCSQAKSAYHAIAPIAYSNTPENALQILLRELRKLPRVCIVESRADYVYAEFSSRWLGYVDDVEFWFEPAQIQVRSASRLGYRDFGVNRRRIEMIRAWF
jgi:uncharacterized protein (DUF1499 family)